MKNDGKQPPPKQSFVAKEQQRRQNSNTNNERGRSKVHPDHKPIQSKGSVQTKENNVKANTANKSSFKGLSDKSPPQSHVKKLEAERVRTQATKTTTSKGKSR